MRSDSLPILGGICFSADLAKVATNEKYFRTFRMQGIFLTTSCVCSGYCAAERVFRGDNTS